MFLLSRNCPFHAMVASVSQLEPSNERAMIHNLIATISTLNKALYDKYSRLCNLLDHREMEDKVLNEEKGAELGISPSPRASTEEQSSEFL